MSRREGRGLETEVSEPWWDLRASPNPRIEAAVVKELHRETGPGHPLLGESVRAVLKSQHCDDVIFAVDATYFVVHLTWIGKPKKPPWPRARSLGGWSETEAYLATHADEAGF